MEVLRKLIRKIIIEDVSLRPHISTHEDGRYFGYTFSGGYPDDYTQVNYAIDPELEQQFIDLFMKYDLNGDTHDVEK